MQLTDADIAEIRRAAMRGYFNLISTLALCDEIERLRGIVAAVEAFDIALAQHQATGEWAPMADRRAFDMIVHWSAVRQLLAAETARKDTPNV